jgi:hypothetical protein
MQAVSPILARATKEEHADVGARLMDTLHGRKQEPFGSGPKLSRDEHFATRMFRHFSEIRKCVERLRDIETLISHYSFSGTRVTRAAYLQFVIEGQLHELYVLQERLLSWLTAIEKAYKSDQRSKSISSATRALRDALRAAFKPLINVRGHHVHEFRYDNSDIGRLELIDLLSQSQDKQFVSAIRFLRKHATQATHTRLKQQTREWNKVAASAVEAVHEVLYGYLFHPGGGAFDFPAPRKQVAT